MMTLESIQNIYPFKSHYVQLTNPKGKQTVRMHYLDEGHGEPVVMLHGNPTWSFMYRHLIKVLKPYNRCLVPDHIGCGLSEKPQQYPYYLQTHIDNTLNWLDQLKIGRFHLIVHDWGGAIGMGVATHWPARVKSLTILNSAAFLSERIPFRIALCRFPILGSFAIKYLNIFAGMATSMATAKGLDNESKMGYLYPYNNAKNRVAINAFVQDIPMHYKQVSYETLEGIQDNLWILANKPVLLAWGMKDFCFTPAFLNKWKEFFPQANVQCFADAGHYVLEDAKDEINAVIRRFIVANQSIKTS